MKCTRCSDVDLDEELGTLGEAVCGDCSGRFMPASISNALLEKETGLNVEQLRELASQFSGPTLPCPGCSKAMSPVTLKGANVDHCLSCGGLWLDASELSRLTGGRIEETGLAPKPNRPEAAARVRPPSVKTVRREKVDVGEFAAFGCLGAFIIFVGVTVMVGGVWGGTSEGSSGGEIIALHEGDWARVAGGGLALIGVGVIGWLLAKLVRSIDG